MDSDDDDIYELGDFFDITLNDLKDFDISKLELFLLIFILIN